MVFVTFFLSDLRFRLRLKGLEFRDYGNRIIKKVFEGTPLQSLNDTIFVATNCQLFGKDINAIKSFIIECEKIDWMTPIGGFSIEISLNVIKILMVIPAGELNRMA